MLNLTRDQANLAFGAICLALALALTIWALHAHHRNH